MRYLENKNYYYYYCKIWFYLVDQRSLSSVVVPHQTYPLVRREKVCDILIPQHFLGDYPIFL